MTQKPSWFRSLRDYLRFLTQGLVVDWLNHITVVLVIAGLFSTPLLLGSIRNKAYVALKEQAEKDYNALELAVSQKSEHETSPLDEGFVAELRRRHPELEIVGNDESSVTVIGPEGRDFVTLKTLYPNDPRTESLRISGGVPEDFGLHDLVLADDTGQLIFGESWESGWDPVTGAFNGPPVGIEVSGTRLAGDFRVVARRGLRGRGAYGSRAMTKQLAMASVGLGASDLGLPPVEDLLQYALPRFETSECLVAIPGGEACPATASEAFLKRLEEVQLTVADEQPIPELVEAGSRQVVVGLTEVRRWAGTVKAESIKGVCSERLAIYVDPLESSCGRVPVAPRLAVSARLNDSPSPKDVTIRGLSPALYALLPGVSQLRDQHGGGGAAKLFALREHPTVADIRLVAPFDRTYAIGQEIELHVGETRVRAQIAAFYRCPEGVDCALFADAMAVRRLQNVEDGILRVNDDEPPSFEPTDPRVDFDQVLVYVKQVEDVEPTALKLAAELDTYAVEYNVTAIQRLQRQHGRLSVLFTATVLLAALFILLSIIAMAAINIRRRSRQMAQMLILGFSRAFVRRLVVAEYLVLTLVGSMIALVSCAAFFNLTRCGLEPGLVTEAADESHGLGICRVVRWCFEQFGEIGASEQARGDFKTIVESMSVDPTAFFSVLLVVLACTLVAAGACAVYFASRVDPVELLE